MSKDITLGGRFEQFVDGQIAAGRFKSADEVVEAALSLLERDAERYQAKLAKLRAAIDEGDQSGVADDSSLESVMADVRAKRSR